MSKEAIKKAENALLEAQTMLLLCKQARAKPMPGSSRRALDQDVALAGLEVQQRQRDFESLTRKVGTS